MSNFTRFDTVTLPANFLLSRAEIEAHRRLAAEVAAADQQRRRTPAQRTLDVRLLVPANGNSCRPIPAGTIVELKEDVALALIAEGKAELT